MATTNKAGIQATIVSEIKSGNSDTTALGLRSVLYEMLDSCVNIKDGGLVYETPVGYNGLLALTDAKSFVYKKWVEDYINKSIIDTAANFTANNPVLLKGQLGIESDDLLTEPKFKIGDGVNDWNTLPYFGQLILQSEHYYTVSGTTVTIGVSTPPNASYFLNGLRCEVGGSAPYDIASIVGTLVTFNEDRTGDRFLAIY